MKKLIAIYLMLTMTIVGYGQILKGANKILVHNSNDKKTNIDLVINTLIEKNIEVGETKDEYGIVKTTPKGFDKLNGEYYLYIVCRDSLVIIIGQMKDNINLNYGYGISTESSYSKIENRGMKGSILKESFNQMDLFANSFKGATIEYKID